MTSPTTYLDHNFKPRGYRGYVVHWGNHSRGPTSHLEGRECFLRVQKRTERRLDGLEPDLFDFRFITDIWSMKHVKHVKYVGKLPQ